MNRKWAMMGATMLAAVIAVSGLSIAQDDEEAADLHHLMEQVQKNNATVIRGVRNEVFYRRYKEDVTKAGKELVELGKKAKPLTETIKDIEVEGGDAIAKWNETMDAYIKEATTFAELAAKEDTTAAQAKDAYKAVSRTCTTCHEVFRIEDADF